MASLPRSQPRTTSCKRVLRRWSEYVEARGTDGCDLHFCRDADSGLGSGLSYQVRREATPVKDSRLSVGRVRSLLTHSVCAGCPLNTLSSSPSLHSMQGVVAVQLAGSEGSNLLSRLDIPPLGRNETDTVGKVGWRGAWWRSSLSSCSWPRDGGCRLERARRLTTRRASPSQRRPPTRRASPSPQP